MRTLWGGEEGLFRMTHIDGTWKETRRGRRRLTSPVLCYVYLCVPACVCKKQKSGNRPRLLFFKWKRKCTKYSGGPPPFLTDWMTSETSGRSLVENRENTQQQAHTQNTLEALEFSLCCYLVLIMAGDWHFPLSESVCVSGACVVCVCCERIDPKDHATSYTLFPLVPKREKNAPG